MVKPLNESYYDELMLSHRQPSRISHADGYVSLDENGEASFYYYLKDHTSASLSAGLGNVRSVITPDADGKPQVEQANDYFPFGMSFESKLPLLTKSGSGSNKHKYNGKEEQEMPGKWLDYGARFYDAALGRWHVPDPLAENHYDFTPYNYVLNNPLLFIDPFGMDTTVHVFDQANRPQDNGTAGTTYTAEVYVDMDGEISGPYSGSAYPNSKSNTYNSTNSNTVSEGEHSYNNKSGHKGSSEKGLNLDDSKNDSRTASGEDPSGNSVTMKYVNVHKGKSDKGNYNSRGSGGCVTIDPSDATDFFNNFDWSGSVTRTTSSGAKKTYTGTTGKSSGKIHIYRGNTSKSVKYNEIKAKQNGAKYNPIKDIYIKNN